MFSFLIATATNNQPVAWPARPWGSFSHTSVRQEHSMPVGQDQKVFPWDYCSLVSWWLTERISWVNSMLGHFPDPKPWPYDSDVLTGKPSDKFNHCTSLVLHYLWLSTSVSSFASWQCHLPFDHVDQSLEECRKFVCLVDFEVCVYAYMNVWKCNMCLYMCQCMCVVRLC